MLSAIFQCDHLIRAFLPDSPECEKERRWKELYHEARLGGRHPSSPSCCYKSVHSLDSRIELIFYLQFKYAGRHILEVAGDERLKRKSDKFMKSIFALLLLNVF